MLVDHDLGYPIVIEKNSSDRLETILAHYKNHQVVIMSDDSVIHHYRQKLEASFSSFDCSFIVLAAGEATKSLATVQAVYDVLITRGITRSDVLVAVGGGVIGDLCGFVAATYLRGIDYIQIPTTLLAQVDSSLGGKVGVDLPQGKNLIGSFYHPRMVIIDPVFLESLPDAIFHAGMAEVIKYGCIYDEDLFSHLEHNASRQKIMADIEGVIARCCTLKMAVVAIDGNDQKERMLLNFGHTYGHSLESYTRYQRYTHGEAVAIGMTFITRVSEQLGLSEPGTADRIARLLAAFALPIASDVDLEALLGLMAQDKKNRSDGLHLVIVKRIGNAALIQADPQFFKGVYHDSHHSAQA